LIQVVHIKGEQDLIFINYLYISNKIFLTESSCCARYCFITFLNDSFAHIYHCVGQIILYLLHIKSIWKQFLLSFSWSARQAKSWSETRNSSPKPSWRPGNFNRIIKTSTKLHSWERNFNPLALRARSPTDHCNGNSAFFTSTPQRVWEMRAGRREATRRECNQHNAAQIENNLKRSGYTPCRGW